MSASRGLLAGVTLIRSTCEYTCYLFHYLSVIESTYPYPLERKVDPLPDGEPHDL